MMCCDGIFLLLSFDQFTLQRQLLLSWCTQDLEVTKDNSNRNIKYKLLSTYTPLLLLNRSWDLFWRSNCCIDQRIKKLQYDDATMTKLLTSCPHNPIQQLLHNHKLPLEVELLIFSFITSLTGGEKQIHRKKKDTQHKI